MSIFTATWLGTPAWIWIVVIIVIVIFNVRFIIKNKRNGRKDGR